MSDRFNYLQLFYNLYEGDPLLESVPELHCVSDNEWQSMASMQLLNLFQGNNFGPLKNSVSIFSIPRTVISTSKEMQVEIVIISSVCTNSLQHLMYDLYECYNLN